MRTFKLPDLGEGLQEAEILTWHVEIGENVVADQPLLSVETDKAVVEIPSPYSGSVKALLAAAGDIIKIGESLVDFEEAVETDTGVIVGELPTEATRVKEESSRRIGERGRVRVAPAVRALAHKLGVDLCVVDASGPDRAITANDVERAANMLAELPPPEPLRGVRRAMAQKMAQSHSEVVPTTVIDDADIEAWPQGTDVTVRLIRAIAEASRAEPALNAWYDNRDESRRLLNKIDLGIAVHTDEGLFVPVMRDVGNRVAADLRRGLENLRRDVEARRIPPEELRGATITLSNFGIFGAGRHAALVVIPPQAAIVGAGRIGPQIVAVDGQPAAHRVLPLSLTFDHRVVNGGEAAGFLAAMIEDLERAE